MGRVAVVIAALIGASLLPSGAAAAGTGTSSLPAANGAAWARLLRPEIPTPPWSRRRPANSNMDPWRGLAAPQDWPAEPVAPPAKAVDPEKLAGALARLCGRSLKQSRALEYAGWMIAHGQRFEVDPFLVAAVLFHQSRLRLTKPRKLGTGVGMARIHLVAHQRQVKGGRYRYYTLEQAPSAAGPGVWKEHELDVSGFAITPASLRKPEAAIYFTAALLSIYQRQASSLTVALRSEPHRHPVSHFYWGDQVLGARFEDRVLRARRLLLQDYLGVENKVLAKYRGIPLHSPLDGVPLKVSSGFYDRRDRRRRHAGVDFVSLHGEPVRAVADGTVFFAGIDMPRRGARIVSPARSGHVRRSSMGRGGLFVIIQHASDVASGYFHLARYTVAHGEAVKGGQLIGYVGRTGIKESPAHLHFEMRYQKRRFNPFNHLRPYLLPPTGHTEVREDKPEPAPSSRSKGKRKGKRKGRAGPSVKRKLKLKLKSHPRTAQARRGKQVAQTASP